MMLFMRVALHRTEEIGSELSHCRLIREIYLSVVDRTSFRVLPFHHRCSDLSDAYLRNGVAWLLKLRKLG